MKTGNNKLKTIIFLLIANTLLVINGYSQMSELVKDKNAGINGGFEVEKEGLPVNWLVYTEKTTKNGDFDIVFDEVDFKEGKQSLKFVIRSCNGKGGRYSPGISQEVPANIGEKFRIKYWVKNIGSEFKVNISTVDALHKVNAHEFKSKETINEWKEFRYEVKIPEKMKQIRIEINVLKPGTFWVDGLTIEKI